MAAVPTVRTLNGGPYKLRLECGKSRNQGTEIFGVRATIIGPHIAGFGWVEKIEGGRRRLYKPTSKSNELFTKLQNRACNTGITQAHIENTLLDAWLAHVTNI